MPKLIIRALICFGLLAGFTAVYPWFLETQFAVAGIEISLRGLGNAYAGILVLLGLSVFIIPRMRSYLAYWGVHLDALNTRQGLKFILISSALLVVPIISYKLRAHYSLGTHAYDLGLFSNVCWNTAFGNWFYSSVYEQHFMAIHASWILWPLSVFYKLGGGASVLLIAQAVCVVAAVPFLWFTVQRITDSFSAGMVASIMYMASPYVGHHLGNDFHPDCWQLPCLTAMLWAWSREAKWEMVLYGLLAVLAKEDVSVVLCGFGVFLMLKRGWRAWGVGLFVTSLAIFLFHVKIFTPQFIDNGATSLLYRRYPLLGDNLREMFLNLFINPGVYIKALAYDPAKYGRLLMWFVPSGFLSFLAPAFLIPVALSVLPHLLSQASTQLNLADIYAMPSQPFIFVGAAVGFLKLLEYGGLAQRKFLIVGVCLLIAGVGIRNTPRFYRKESAARLKAFTQLKDMVPADASVAAQQNLLPHLDLRRYIQLFPMGMGTPEVQSKYLENPEYVVCDRIGNALPYDGARLKKSITAMEFSPKYVKVFERENFLLFKRIMDHTPRWNN